MPTDFTTANGIEHITLSATPGEQTEVNFHNDARACDVEFFAAGDLTTSAAGQVTFTSDGDGQPIGTHKWRPVAANTDWPFALQFDGSQSSIQKIYLSSLVASAIVVVVSFEAPQ